MLKVMYRRTGRAGGRDEAHHIVNWDNMKTLCGRDAADWFDLDTSPAEAVKSAYCCAPCSKRFAVSEGGE